MEDLRKELVLKLRRYHLTWLVSKTLQAGNFEIFFEDLCEDPDIAESLERLAWSDESKKIRCEAIRHMYNLKALSEMAQHNDCMEARYEAGRRMMEMFTE